MTLNINISPIYETPRGPFDTPLRTKISRYHITLIYKAQP